MTYLDGCINRTARANGPNTRESTVKLKRFSFFGGKIEVSARNQKEARVKADECARVALISADSIHTPLTFAYRGYVGIVYSTTIEGAGSFIVDPSGHRRAFCYGGCTGEQELKRLADHIRAMADDELGEVVPALVGDMLACALSGE